MKKIDAYYHDYSVKNVFVHYKNSTDSEFQTEIRQIIPFGWTFTAFKKRQS